MSLNFQDRPSVLFQRVLLVVLLVVSLVLMTVYSREGENGVLHTVQGAVSNAVAPIKVIGASAGSLVEGAQDTVGDMTASPETLSALREQNAELIELVTQAEEYRLEAQRLQDLLGLKDTYDIEGVAGRVIGRSSDAWNQSVTLDVGTDNGVEVGLTVMGPNGVIGQVVSVSPGSSTVRLLTDPQSGAAAMIQSSRVEGVVRGSLSGLLYLENLEADAVVNVGDVVLTSGLGGSYTRGLLIGTVVRVEGNATDGTRRVIVSPNEQATSFEEVMVVFSAAESSSDGAADANEGGGDQ